MSGYTAYQTDPYTGAGQVAFQTNAFQVFFYGIPGDPGPTAPITHKKKQIVKQEDARDIDDIFDAYLGS